MAELHCLLPGLSFRAWFVQNSLQGQSLYKTGEAHVSLCDRQMREHPATAGTNWLMLRLKHESLMLTTAF